MTTAPVATHPSGRALERPGARESNEWVLFAARLARRRTALFGLIVVALVVVTSLAAPWLTPFDPIEQDIAQRLKAPGARDDAGRLHPLGTDHLGRDLLARVIFGAQPALLVGFAAVVISGLLGMTAGHVRICLTFGRCIAEVAPSVDHLLR